MQSSRERELKYKDGAEGWKICKLCKSRGNNFEPKLIVEKCIRVRKQT